METGRWNFKIRLGGDKENGLEEILSNFEFSHCLVDGDGYSVEFLYFNKNISVYYYHRQKNEGYISILGIVDWKLEMMRFLARINQFFGIDLFEFENRIMNDVDIVQREHKL
ncbi:hypothetical protein [Cognataquiflexum rubidum]|uniref:hypothetical protein n=1 Tax=Cognataquiflexum rubidum TaxID=2922273 RepID=UPI001F13B4BA|nr:hypothetical protein [Cognataquiflexum rubidum]MCH6236566.1 hypothetical protein [Cognataquiflexum rubidum]